MQVDTVDDGAAQTTSSTPIRRRRPFSRVDVFAAVAAPYVHCVGYSEDGTCSILTIERHDG